MPPRVLVDTNVIVGALRNPSGRSASGQVVQNVLAAYWQGVCSTATYLETFEVLLRPEFQLPRQQVLDFMEALADAVEWSHPVACSLLLRDAGDQKWLNLLHGSRANALVTYNLRDFRPALERGYPVMPPAEALRVLAGTA